MSAFWSGRMTRYLVLFWYLSLRNSSRYSDPSVWGGSFTDEVRLLAAMKQYLKQIKRHFPQLDSCFFPLAQVLHLMTKRWSEHKRCANALLRVFGRSKDKESLLSVETLSDRHFRIFISHLCNVVLVKDWCARPNIRRITSERDKHPWSARSDCSS